MALRKWLGNKDGGASLRQAIKNAFRGYGDEIYDILDAEKRGEKRFLDHADHTNATMDNRDSKIGIYIEDIAMVNSIMDGEPLAHELPEGIFKEHMGLLPHVEHDVITKASVLPIDLDAPDKDPEPGEELIRKVTQRLKSTATVTTPWQQLPPRDFHGK
ncbi:hypothetical protein BGX21_011535 [Mortierella sp. AD011]|nr:hypothetical protein BGX20_009460 [Mortierella sp. AD010]KAF9390161.1 hypothetical protein BGX21_011535 [Mortierella sp. AD011]